MKVELCPRSGLFCCFPISPKQPQTFHVILGCHPSITEGLVACVLAGCWLNLADCDASTGGGLKISMMPSETSRM